MVSGNLEPEVLFEQYGWAPHPEIDPSHRNAMNKAVQSFPPEHLLPPRDKEPCQNMNSAVLRLHNYAFAHGFVLVVGSKDKRAFGGPYGGTNASTMVKRHVIHVEWTVLRRAVGPRAAASWDVGFSITWHGRAIRRLSPFRTLKADSLERPHNLYRS